MLTSVTSYAVLANAEGLFGVTLMIYRSQAQKSSIIVHNIELQMTTGLRLWWSDHQSDAE